MKIHEKPYVFISTISKKKITLFRQEAQFGGNDMQVPQIDGPFRKRSLLL